mgnify:CR=1 FL=1|jgi:DNA polymerase III subunit alpha
MENVGFEHIHLHSHFSLLDGFGDPAEYAKRAVDIGQKHLCISDHGMMAAIPPQIRACDKFGISPIFACELYINPEQMELKAGEVTGLYAKQLDEEAKLRLRKSYHLLAVAYNDVGYSNLVALSSWAWTKGFYYKPRINYEVLQEHREGIIFSSACYNGEIGQAFDRGGADEAMKMIRKYQEMFGEFYLEIMLLDFDKQKPYDAFLINAHRETGLPLVLTNDCHYAFEKDSYMQQLMLMIQTNKTLAEIEEKKEKAEKDGVLADLFELQDTNLWMKSEDELNQKWEQDYYDVIPYEYFVQAKLNTISICEQAAGVELDRSVKLPTLPDDKEEFRKAIMRGFEVRQLPKTQEYLERIKEEYALICEKEFASYFLLTKMMTDEARRYWDEKTGGYGEYAVGPARGSGAGSLACYCLGITDVDPVKHGLLFSRFLSPARGGKTLKLRFDEAKMLN